MRQGDIEVGKTYSKDPDRPGRRFALDRTVVSIDVPTEGGEKIVLYESDAVIGRRSCTLSVFAAWARRAV